MTNGIPTIKTAKRVTATRRAGKNKIRIKSAPTSTVIAGRQFHEKKAPARKFWVVTLPVVIARTCKEQGNNDSRKIRRLNCLATEKRFARQLFKKMKTYKRVTATRRAGKKIRIKKRADVDGDSRPTVPREESARPKEFRAGAFSWSYWPDLNRRPADYESAALPTEPQ